MTIKRYSHWWENSPPDFTYQPQLPTHADAIVIGAGFAGLSTAYWMLRYSKRNKRPYRIIVLDEAPYPAFKSSGRMIGSVYLGDNGTADAAVDRYSAKIAKQLYNYSAQNNSLLHSLVDEIDCGAEFNGGMRMASTAKEVMSLDKSEEILTSWGFTAVRFDHDKSQHLMIAPYAKGSLFIPHEGMLDPFALTNKLAQILRKNGVWVTYGARVEYTENTEAYGPTVHLANGHSITASKIIHTTPETIPWDRVEEKVVYCREQVAKTQAMNDDLGEAPLPIMPIEFNQGLESIRLYEGAVIMAGGKSGLKRDPELDVTDDTFQNQRVLDHLDMTMMKHFPFANHLELTHTWTYINTEMSDGLPLMGEIPDFTGHYANIAHGKNKFGLAFLGAKNVAERALRVKMQNPEFKIFDPKRLTRGE